MKEMICPVHNEVDVLPFYQCPTCALEGFYDDVIYDQPDYVAQAHAIAADKSNQSPEALRIRALMDLHKYREEQLRGLPADERAA